MPHSMAVGIDVAKQTLDVTILSANEKVQNKSFRNSRQDILKLSKYLLKHNVAAETQVIIESTGDYHLEVSYTLGKVFNVQIINPIVSKRLVSTNVRKQKTDRTDSLALAKLGLQSTFNEHLFTSNELRKRKIISQISMLEKHKVSLALSLKNIGETLKKFGIESKGVDEIEQAIESLETAIKLLQGELAELVERKGLVQALANQTGISITTAVIVTAIIEDRRFKSKRSLVAYSGLDVTIKESGKWRGVGKLTKRGNNYLRKYLIQIAWGLLMHNEAFKVYAKKYKEKGRKYKEILVLIARKFLHMLYGAMTKDAEFSTKYMDAH